MYEFIVEPNPPWAKYGPDASCRLTPVMPYQLQRRSTLSCLSLSPSVHMDLSEYVIDIEAVGDVAQSIPYKPEIRLDRR